MFYHIKIMVTGVISWVEYNKTKDVIFSEYVCPFINREVTLLQGEDNTVCSIFNMSSYGQISIFKTDKPVDSDWPIKKGDFKNAYDYKKEILQSLIDNSKDVTSEIFKEAIILIENGTYKESRTKLLESLKGNYSFYVCPFENAEVDHNYEFVIKPLVKQYQYEIQRADEISHTRTITETIINAIMKSRFVIAELTDERPNCYYEVGYAHALGKPVIILAKEDTQRHFDLGHYKWIYWNDYKDLKFKLEKELEILLKK